MRALRGTLLLVALAVVCPSISCDRPRVEGPGRSYEFIVLEVKGQSLSVEVAADAQARTLGLKHREHMDENKGMIFIFNAPSIQKFWMRNTLIALSIAFIDDSGRILHRRHEAEGRAKDCLEGQGSIRSRDEPRLV